MTNFESIRSRHSLPDNSQLPKKENVPVNMEAVNALVNVRLLEFSLKKNMQALSNPAQDQRYQVTNQSLYSAMSGELDFVKDGNLEDLNQQLQALREKAEAFEKNNSRSAAFVYAKMAKLKVEYGQDATWEKEQTMRCLSLAGEIPVSKSSDLFPQAILLGLEKISIKNENLPTRDQMVEAVKKNKDLLRKYALVLSESERQSFIDALPPASQDIGSILMDYELSYILPKDFAVSEEDNQQRQAILNRAHNKLKQILIDSKEGYLQDLEFIFNTLGRLEGDEGSRILAEVGPEGLKNANTAEQQQGRYQYLAKLLEFFVAHSPEKAVNLLRKFLGKSDLPAHYFSKFFQLAVNQNLLTKNSLEYFQDKRNWPFLKKMLAEYPNQFDTVFDTLSKINNYQPYQHESEIFQAIHDLDSLTPIIFNRYRLADKKGKKELAQKIKDLKPMFFRNQAIGEVLPREDREILAEMVYLSYQPVGMNFQVVNDYISKLEDRVADLQQFYFPAGGYDFKMTGGKKFVLRKGEKLDQKRLQSYKNLFEGQVPQKEEEILEFYKLLERIVKAGTEFSEAELQSLLGVMGADQTVRKFLERNKNLSGDKTYNYLNELKELLGIYFKDNYPDRLRNFMGANQKLRLSAKEVEVDGVLQNVEEKELALEDKILKILSNPNRQEILKKKLADDGLEIDWDGPMTREKAAFIISVFVQKKVLKMVQNDLSRDLNKFEAGEEDEIGEIINKRNLKAFISKNVGSFFAKASAGICTAGDVTLFKRKDHFHINVVENEQKVQGNIQAYIIDYPKGKKALLLRGFNPNTSFLNSINAEDFCEAVLRIARQFQADNNLEGVYITEHLSGWHALSNREPVAKYLLGKYVKDKNQHNFNFPITGQKSVDYIYKV